MNTFLTALQVEKELPNKDLLYISYSSVIPELRRESSISVVFKNGEIEIVDHSRQIPDPSTIYIHLPISEDYKVLPLSYWPHYIEMTSGQRFTYLSWLRDVTKPIDIGYVFIYYYGLERQLLTGHFDKAFDEIIKLRNIHKNKSFLKYSENALINAAILKNRQDRLIDLHEKTEISEYSNMLFSIAHKMNIALGVQQLSLIFHKAFPYSRKALRDNKELFISCISSVLKEYNDSSVFPISNYDIKNTRFTTIKCFANYSFSEELQTRKVKDFYQCKRLMEDIEKIYNISHKLYIEQKALLRKKKTSEEVKTALKKKDENRYKKLLKSKLINQQEFELLTQKLKR